MRFVDSYEQCSTQFLLCNDSKISIKLLNSFPNWKIVVGSLVARTRILDFLNPRIEYWSYFMGANLGVEIRDVSYRHLPTRLVFSSKIAVVGVPHKRKEAATQTMSYSSASIYCR